MDRVDSLEERMAHLMRAVEDLSDVVLEGRVRLLMERAAEEEAFRGPPEANVRPPHW